MPTALQQTIGLKYLIFTEDTAAIIHVPIGTSSDKYGELQERFLQQFGRGKFDFVSMLSLAADCFEFDVWYHWELAGSGGASFELFQFPDTPEGKVKALAKRIHSTRDVVRLKVLHFKSFVEFPVFESGETAPGKPALTAEQVAAANIEYRRTMTAENRILRDDTISPFYFGLVFAGYEIVMNHPVKFETDKLGPCPDCKNLYSNRVIRDGVELWACPFCNVLHS